MGSNKKITAIFSADRYIWESIDTEYMYAVEKTEQNTIANQKLLLSGIQLVLTWSKFTYNRQSSAQHTNIGTIVLRIFISAVYFSTCSKYSENANAPATA